jgi:hypothetical protein
MADAFDAAWAIIEPKAKSTGQNPEEAKLALAKRIVELVSLETTTFRHSATPRSPA